MPHEERAALDMLRAVGRELGGLAAAMERTQEALSPALTRALLDSPAAFAGLQELDRVTQELHALSGVAARLAEGMERGEAADLPALLAPVPLADLSRRLAGPQGSAP